MSAATLIRPRPHAPTTIPLPTPASVAEAAREMDGAPATDILRWAWRSIPRFCITSSFGADSATLLSLVAQVDPDIPVLFLDTGFHFAESLEYRETLTARLGLRRVVDVRPWLSVEDQASLHGESLHDRDPDACCQIRKVAPLEQALLGFDGWATGLRRSQGPSRKATPVVSRTIQGGRSLLKVAPLANWTAADVAGHRLLHDLPPHPLAARGFGSIGCEPCTRPIAIGDDPRTGRWAGMIKTECGIHLGAVPEPETP